MGGDGNPRLPGDGGGGGGGNPAFPLGTAGAAVRIQPNHNPQQPSKTLIYIPLGAILAQRRARELMMVTPSSCSKRAVSPWRRFDAHNHTVESWGKEYDQAGYSYWKDLGDDFTTLRVYNSGQVHFETANCMFDVLPQNPRKGEVVEVAPSEKWTWDGRYWTTNIRGTPHKLNKMNRHSFPMWPTHGTLHQDCGVWWTWDKNQNHWLSADKQTGLCIWYGEVYKCALPKPPCEKPQQESPRGMNTTQAKTINDSDAFPPPAQQLPSPSDSRPKRNRKKKNKSKIKLKTTAKAHAFTPQAQLSPSPFDIGAIGAIGQLLPQPPPPPLPHNTTTTTTLDPLQLLDPWRIALPAQKGQSAAGSSDEANYQ